ncbi:hypothetical protein GOODEAATRI_000906, partial [Goodea atripinnis]
RRFVEKCVGESTCAGSFEGRKCHQWNLKLVPPRGLGTVTCLAGGHLCPDENLAEAVSILKAPRGKRHTSDQQGLNRSTAGLAYMHPFWAACLFIACLSFERMETGCQVLTPPHMASSINRTNQASRGGRTDLIASQI